MPSRYLTFDIEIAKELPETDPDWTAHRPLGITCAATLTADTDELLLWHGRNPDKGPAEQMSRCDVRKLVEYLQSSVESGYTILTWNGLGFDIDILAEESGLFETCRRLAGEHVDMMFQVHCTLGFPVALDRAAKAMGLGGKPEGMSGILAPRYWAEGKHQQVLDYVAQDVRITLELGQLCARRGHMQWVARSGKVRGMELPDGWIRVDAARALPEPDTSWMSSPLPRSRFTGWLDGRTVGMTNAQCSRRTSGSKE